MNHLSLPGPHLSGSTQDLLNFAEGFSTSASHSLLSSGYDEVPATVNADSVAKLITSVLKISNKTAVSGITVENQVRKFCQAFEQLDSEESRLKIMEFLAQQDVKRKKISELATAYSNTEDPLVRSRVEDQLRQSLQPSYYWLFQKIGALPGGVKFLVDFRAQLISFCLSNLEIERTSALKSMSSQLKQLLSHWFSVGFLDLDQITWDSPCSMLQKISDYEAVHPMRNWTDLKARVGPYRRCFVYTHKSMPGEPIVVLHVALTEEIPESISKVVKHHRMVKKYSVDSHQSSGSKTGREGEDPSSCEAAIFYSITSTQTGLQGIELGTQLIKQAVQKLKEELPDLNQFCTLSPIPGFRKWLLILLQTAKRDGKTLAQTDLLTIDEAEKWQGLIKMAGNLQESDLGLGTLIQLVKTNSWMEDQNLIAFLEQPLMRLCARYLYLEKRRSNALDSVANFHLRNGAVLWRLNWEGDRSVRGLTNSCGIMVNYKYVLDDLEPNSTNYQENHKVKASEQVIHLASQAKVLQRKLSL
ncbi:hypothetical protein TCAL_10735 [Tigriopus californicus]|uniref:Malonyl-CoA decarboxylase C-terminal domain-containing protein n=2 Tax=Tigriopus californicus TaxID=6832 RepID=A0A553NUY7_TIGCA|nr:hypothetical protein TCAL_10735 [Tigriopus californicus]|eukprot:TCALIF_10735-PA protein Name:"Similar to MLYCD Malonyl-CoA decarboxylase, mitochondrial (Homo sapiens)" AED:0.03 eAED:0.03 QI:0/-1/0/1/-1/1/1/0/528